MGLRQKIKDSKDEYKAVYKEAREQTRERGLTRLHQEHLDKRAADHNRAVKEAAQRLLASQSVSTNRETGEAKPWGVVRQELESLQGHLIIVSSLHHALGLGYAEKLVTKMKSRVGSRDAIVGFSVHCSKHRQENSPSATKDFLEGATDLRLKMAQQGFNVLAGEIAAPEQNDGIGLPQIVESADQTRQKAEEESKDYLHVAVVSGLELDEVGIARGSQAVAAEDSQMTPHMLIGFEGNDKPKWTNLTRLSPNNET